MASKRQKVLDKDRFSIMVKSLDKCFVCLSDYHVQKHEVFHGVSNRVKSIEDGLVIPLCDYHHNGSNVGIHHNKKFEDDMKREAEICWIDEYCSISETPQEKIDDFINRYHENLLDVDNENDLEVLQRLGK